MYAYVCKYAIYSYVYDENYLDAIDISRLGFSKYYPVWYNSREPTPDAMFPIETSAK